jgi:hypothetical protein
VKEESWLLLFIPAVMDMAIHGVIVSLNLTLTWKSLVFIRRARSFILFMLEGSVKVVLQFWSRFDKRITSE